MCLIFYLSSSTKEVSQLPNIEGLDKILHFTAYGCLGVFYWFPCIVYDISHKIKLSVLSSFLYGCSDEYHQSFVVGRSSEFLDIVADFIGALFFVFVFNCLYLYFKNQKASSK